MRLFYLALAAKLPKLRQLKIEKNQIGDDRIIALSKNTALEQLEASHNHIGDRGAEAFRMNTAIWFISQS